MAGKKRKANDDQQTASSKQPKQDGQKALSKDITVPIDEGFTQPNAVQVYVDEENVIYDASLMQSNVSNNNNKFYRLQLLDNRQGTFYTHTRWGRVGERGQIKTLGPSTLDEAMTEFKKKFKDKSGHKWEDRSEEPKKNKYTFIEKSYVDDDEDKAQPTVKEEEKETSEWKASCKEKPQSTLPIPTQQLMELIFNTNHFDAVLENIGYNNEKLPLGKLGKSTLKKGFERLQDISDLLSDMTLAQSKYQVSFNEAIEDLTNQYYSTIPHIFGRMKPPLINHDNILKHEIEMLDTLSDMEVASKIMKKKEDEDADEISLIDQRFRQLNIDQLEPIDHDAKEFSMLKDYLINTSGQTHAIEYKVQDIFRLTRADEYKRFDKSRFAKIDHSCRRLLWHGSRTTNFGGILSQGLRIAPKEAPASGYAFGKGIYLADISTKSANYCASMLSGGTGLLLLCEAELGDPMFELTSGNFEAAELSAEGGFIATKGVGRTVPQKDWLDASSIHDSLKGVLMPDISKPPHDQDTDGYLQYNEYIAYDVAQVKLRYLLRVQMD